MSRRGLSAGGRLKASRKTANGGRPTAAPDERTNERTGLAVASIARDDPSTLPGDDPFPRARRARVHAGAQGKFGSEFET